MGGGGRTSGQATGQQHRVARTLVAQPSVLSASVHHKTSTNTPYRPGLQLRVRWARCVGFRWAWAAQSDRGPHLDPGQHPQEMQCKRLKRPVVSRE